MFKTIGLFIFMNILVNILFLIVLFLIEYFFGIRLFGNNNNYLFIFLGSLVFGFVGSFTSLFLSKWLAKRRYSIEIITYNNYNSDNEKILLDFASEFSERNNMKIPEIGIYQSDEVNAFTVGTGKNNALISFSTGLINKLNKNEIEGIIAHEIASLTNGDMLTMALMQGLINAFVVFFARVISNIINEYIDGGLGMIAYMVINIGLQIIFGILSMPLLIKFAHYRTKKADIKAAKMIGKEKVILSLKSLINSDYFEEEKDGEFDNLKINGKSNGLFSTHPDLDDRIKALEEMRI